MAAPSSITPQALQRLLLGDGELALLDVREARAFVTGHLNLARLAPLSALALEVRALVPRLSTPVVLVDGGEGGEGGGAGLRAADLLARLGYADVRLLEGGTRAWQAAGLPLIDGYATLVKAFGGQVLARHATPSMRGQALRARQAAGRSSTLIDARPADEYAWLALPDAHNHPGTELALRDWEQDAQPGPWVVNCFSRTRGIIGSSTLRLLGHPSAYFLEDGVMQWALEGAAVRQQAQRAADLPVADDARLRQRADTLIARHGLPLLAPDALPALQADAGRTLYQFDLRPEASSDGLPTGVRAIAGGQLLMHFEQLVGTRGARILLIDEPHKLRAAVTAFWLLQLGQAEVLILDGELPLTGPADGIEASDPHEAAGAGLEPNQLAALLRHAPTQLHVIDVGPSADYERRHLPGAHFLLPHTLEPLAALTAAGRRLIFASPDGRAARWVAAETRRRWSDAKADWLKGGTEAWQATGQRIESAWEPARLLTPFDDDWGSVMRIPPEQRERAWTDYLRWERGLDARVLRDPTVRFRFFPAARPATASGDWPN